jgi:hypothetical protein
MVKKGIKNKSRGGNPSNVSRLLKVPRQYGRFSNSTGVMPSAKVTLTYMESFLTTALGGYLTIRGNDLFDPQATTSGVSGTSNQQPQFFDSWSRMYSKYRVIGSRIKVQICTTSTTALPVFFTVTPEDALVSTTNAAQSSTQSYSKYVLMGQGVSNPGHTIESSMTTALINGISQEDALVNPNYLAGVGSSPADPWYWQVRYSSADFSTAVAFYGFVHVYFDVIFSDPQTSDTNDFYSAWESSRMFMPIGESHYLPRVSAPVYTGPLYSGDGTLGKDETKSEYVEVISKNLIRRSELNIDDYVATPSAQSIVSSSSSSSSLSKKK